MTMNDELTLISVEHTIDADGFATETRTRIAVPVEVRSVARAEFYEARKAGISLSAAFLMWECDYSGQPLVEYHGTTYAVERTYTGANKAGASTRGTRGGEIELYCSEAVE